MGARAGRGEEGEDRVRSHRGNRVARGGDVFRKNVGRNCATDSLQPFDFRGAEGRGGEEGREGEGGVS